MKKFAIGNWKMYFSTPAETKKAFAAIAKMAAKSKAEIAVCPSSIFLMETARGYRGKVRLGVQDVFFEKTGPWTGELSADMAAAAGATYALVGHSERRALCDDDVRVELKLKAALAAGLSPVLCVGERERDHSGAYFGFIENQLVTALRTVPKKDATRVIIAYEPVFAIGKSAEDALTPPEAEEMAIFIRKTLTRLYDADIARIIPVLYGGSVEPSNVEGLAECPGIAGFLVGRSSTKPEDFEVIINALN